MSEDTIYLRQFLDLEQAALRDLVGVNLADVRQLQDLLLEKGEKFNKGIIPENEAADLARKMSYDALNYEIHANEELKQLQEKLRTPIQYSSETEEYFDKMSEEQKSLILSENEKLRQLPISNIENIIAELKRLREMAMYLTAHIQDYAITPEYRERRMVFITTGEAPKKPVPETQIPPVIQDILKEGLLDNSLVNGKYFKKGDKKDKEIIEWVFDYSGYGDSLTADLYMQHIYTTCKITTIQDYITRGKKAPD